MSVAQDSRLVFVLAGKEPIVGQIVLEAQTKLDATIGFVFAVMGNFSIC